MLLEQFSNRLRCELTSAVTMMYTTFQQRPTMNGFYKGSFNQVHLHVVSHCVGKNKAGHYVFDGTKIVKAFSSPYVADITGNNLEGLGNVQASNQIRITCSPSISAVS